MYKVAALSSASVSMGRFYNVLREGTPPFPVKRYAIIGFDSIDKAKD